MITGAHSIIYSTNAEADRNFLRQAQRGFRGLMLRGPLDFSLIGIVASLSAALAAASVSIFVVSTHDTDYLFVPDADIARAIAALRDAGHTVATGV